MTTRIGFIGLGLMGLPMAKRLCAAGYVLNIHNRTKQKAQELIDAGMRWYDTPRETAFQSAIVHTMLSSSEVLEEVALGSDGILAGMNAGEIHVDHSTVSPDVTRRLFDAYAAKETHFIHCPVLGSIPQAIDGTLLLFPGGNAEAIETVIPVLKHFGTDIWRFDSVEKATHVKLLCNSFIAGMILTLGQALSYCRKTGVDGKTLLDIIGHSALGAPMYQTKGSSILEGNFTPRFYLEHLLKDVTLFITSAKTNGVPVPAAEIVRKYASEAVAEGFAKEDYSAIVKMLMK